MRSEKRDKEFQLLSNGVREGKEKPRRSMLPALKTAGRNAGRNVRISPADQKVSTKWQSAENAKSMSISSSSLEKDGDVSGGSSSGKDREEWMPQRRITDMEIGRPKKPQVQMLLQQELKAKDRKIACQLQSLKKLQMDLVSANNHIGFMKMEMEDLKTRALERKSYIEQQQISKGKLSEELKTARKQNIILMQQVECSERAQRVLKERYKLVVYEAGLKDSKVKSLEKKVADSTRVLVRPTCTRRRSDSLIMSLEWKCPSSKTIIELPRRISCKSLLDNKVTLSVDAQIVNENREQPSSLQ